MYKNWKPMVRDFLNTTMTIDEGFKIAMSKSEIQNFLTVNNYALSVKEFNKNTFCERRTTGNKYVYDLINLSNGAASKVQRGRINEFSSNKIKALNYYGSKRTWQEEFRLLYRYAACVLGCSTMADIFSGSGFLALLASKTGVFKKIVLNELSNTVYNYHVVQKDLRAFNEFITYISRWHVMDKHLYNVLKIDWEYGQKKWIRKKVQELQEAQIAQLAQGKQIVLADAGALYEQAAGSAENERKREHISKGNATNAAALFILKSYAHSGQGGYIENRMAPHWNVEALQETQKLYKGIKLSHLHYSKALKSYMNNAKCLIILDPPYLVETRVQKESYQHEFSERQHRTLLQLLTKQNINAKIVLCGYHSSLYENYFLRYNQSYGTCWHEVKLLNPGRKGTEAKERIWVNFDVASLVNNHKDLFEFIW